jgi:hypothetical protein
MNDKEKTTRSNDFPLGVSTPDKIEYPKPVADAPPVTPVPNAVPTVPVIAVPPVTPVVPDDNDEFVFADPPQSVTVGRQTPTYGVLLTKLAAAPGRWAQIKVPVADKKDAANRKSKLRRNSKTLGLKIDLREADSHIYVRVQGATVPATVAPEQAAATAAAQGGV